MDGALEVGVLAGPLEKADVVDIVETTEDIDSSESRLLNCSEGLRGGRAGERSGC